MVAASLAVFSHFLQLSSLYMYVKDTSLQVPLVGPDSHYVYRRDREFIEFQFLLNFKLLAPSWEAVHCRTLIFVDSSSCGCSLQILDVKEIFF